MTDPQINIADHLIALERAALTRWCNGDPSGFLEISAHEIVYFDPFREHRIDGLPALTQYYEALAGKIRADRFDIHDPQVHATPDMAVLTFQFTSSWAGADHTRWHCTEAYRRTPEGWRIVATHWSFADRQK